MPTLRGEAWVNSPERRRRDLKLVAAAAPFLTPLAIAGLTASRLVDGSEPIIVQERVGKDGKPFDIYKIRTMNCSDSEISHGALDTRATRLGKWLRLTTIDELPQLINILKGDMAVFNPRALIASEIADMKQVLPRNCFDQWEHVYMTAGPGAISGFGLSAHGQPRNIEASYHARAELDIYDFEYASLEHDQMLLAHVGKAAARALQNTLHAG